MDDAHRQLLARCLVVAAKMIVVLAEAIEPGIVSSRMQPARR